MLVQWFRFSISGLNQQQRQHHHQHNNTENQIKRNHTLELKKGALIIQGSLNDVVDWCDTIQWLGSQEKKRKKKGWRTPEASSKSS